MKNPKEKIQLILEQENDRMRSLLNSIIEGNKSRLHIEKDLKKHIHMNEKMQEISKEL